jgi:hypothetical protein
VETNPSSHKTSAASNEVPLYPGLTWAQAENEQLTVSTGFGSDSVELPGSSYLSESIRGKPEHDLRYFYSVEALANSEWYLVDEGLGVGAEKTVYYKEPNQYLVVQFGKCDGGNSLEYRCFKVWISSPDANPFRIRCRCRFSHKTIVPGRMIA